MRLRLRRIFRRRLRRTRMVGMIALAITVVALSAPFNALASSDLGDTSAAIETGTSTWEMTSGGATRTFRLYVPSTADLSKPSALVVMMHGGFGSADQAQSAYGWDDMAEGAGFIVAYPDGLGRAWNGGGGCCGKSGATGVDDVGFITDMIAAISDRIAIDPARIYATGMSNGAILSYRLACETDLFAAIAPVSGTQLVECASPNPTSVLHIHGMDDASVRYDGSRGNGVANIDGPPIPDLIAFWEGVNGCSSPVVATLGDVTDSYAQCPDGRAVELLSIANMGHTWPGGGSGPIGELRAVNRGGDDFIATVVIWEFFASHPKPGN